MGAAFSQKVQRIQVMSVFVCVCVVCIHKEKHSDTAHEAEC